MNFLRYYLMTRQVGSILLLFIGLLILLFTTGCKKLVEIESSVGSISEDNVFTSNSTAIAAVTGIYTAMGNGTSGSFTGPAGISFLAGLSADEFTLFNGVIRDRENAYYKNTLSAVDAPIAGSDTWSPLYNLVYRCNAIIAGLNDPAAAALTPAVRQQLLGEAKFLRAFYYFYLVNMYGDVPLAVQTDPQINTALSRSPKEQVYQFMVDELKQAKDLLSEDYLNAALSGSTNERVRPTRWAAMALLARTFLYRGEYANAEAQTTEIIANAGQYDTVGLNSVFLKNSKEAIWQLQPVDQFFNTRDARMFVITSAGPNNNQPVYLSPYLLSAFENGDNRLKDGNWVNKRVVGTATYQYAFKYKLFAQDTTIKSATGTQKMGEYVMVLRLGEQYLIRAEARIKQNKIPEGIEDLNVLRRRASAPLPNNLLPLPTSLTREEAEVAVLHERQVELFTEWGHRWFDLKRTGNIDAVMNIVTPQKSQGTVAWRPYQQLYPILQDDVNKSPNLSQNTGY